MADPPSGVDPNPSGNVQVDDQDAEVGIDPRDVASAGRSCSVILILTAAIILALCVGIALRWVILG